MNKLRIWLILPVILVFAALYLYQELQVAGSSGFPVDDAWIHAQFARNIANGDGMSYNPGVPVSGSTAPLWTFMLALSYVITHDAVFTVKVLGLVFYALSCALVFKVLRFISNDERFALLGAVFTAMLSILMWGALSGMEVMLSVFLTLQGVYLHLIYRKEIGLKQYASTVFFALASLARPESMLLVFIALLDRFILGFAEKEETIRKLAARAVVHLSLFLVLLVPYFLFNYSINSEPFPSTFAAKRGGGLMVVLSSGDMTEFRKMLFFYPRLYIGQILRLSLRQNILLYVFMYVGIGRLIFDSFRKKDSNKALMIPLTFFLYPAIVGMAAPSKDGVVWMYRYMGNLMPLFVIMGTVGFRETFLFLGSCLSKLWTTDATSRKINRAALFTVTLLMFVSLSVEGLENSKFYANGVQNINDMHVKIGRWIKENTPSDSLLAVNDIGAITYFSGRRIIDLVGIVTPQAVSYKNRPGGTFEFITLKKPDYVIIYPKWFPDLPEHKELMPMFEVVLQRNAVSGGPKMVVYKTIWSVDAPGTDSRGTKP